LHKLINLSENVFWAFPNSESALKPEHLIIGKACCRGIFSPFENIASPNIAGVQMLEAPLHHNVPLVWGILCKLKHPRRNLTSAVPYRLCYLRCLFVPLN
jgi:hypothetical protein